MQRELRLPSLVERICSNMPYSKVFTPLHRAGQGLSRPSSVILDAVSLVCQGGVYAAIICDSKPALQSLTVVYPIYLSVVQQILSFLSLLNIRGLCIKFIWIPSHDSLRLNVTVDRLAKEACRLP